ncbi:hypothetical protein [Roseimaritima multifibrata]|uniref:hypothetical protein n=1 Tax=Roseimaritima multifibrata TaxID=1930274 RepID=UPI0011A77C0E|nr:hypothetical protein [Roseimaritima multifibrata]
MEFLGVFAIVILSVLDLTLIGVWALLGMMPGRIARGRTCSSMTRRPSPRELIYILAANRSLQAEMHAPVATSAC